jgi:hypothetical protein
VADGETLRQKVSEYGVEAIPAANFWPPLGQYVELCAEDCAWEALNDVKSTKHNVDA